MKKSKNKVVFETCGGNTITTITMTCKYPKENPPGTIESITDALRYVGVFNEL
ncbi:MAG: hypothetical protein WCX95_00570 [Candidatus Gracilibacteria bacterium]